MPATNEYTHPINVRSTQMDMPSSSRINDDFDDKIKCAQMELERIQLERLDLERKKQELEQLTSRKRVFLSQQVELTERFSSAITLIERELYEMREETDQLEQCRTCFVDHLEKIQKHDPENWTRDKLPEKLERAMSTTDLAADEYDQAAAYFSDSRSGAIFGNPSKGSSRKRKSVRSSSEFSSQLLSGLAFNLPIIVTAGIGIAIYLFK